MARYDADQHRRLEARPGITGWAQVNGRSAPPWEERLRLDVWYVENASFALDLGILLRTIYVTLTGSGVSALGHATMPVFLGASGDQPSRSDLDRRAEG